MRLSIISFALLMFAYLRTLWGTMFFKMYFKSIEVYIPA